MSEHCQHEQSLGRITSDITTIYKRLDKQEEDINNLREQNTTIIELNVNLRNLVTEVKENNEKFHKMFADHDLRINIMEHAEGDYLAALKRKSFEDIIRYLIVAIVSGGIGILIRGGIG